MRAAMIIISILLLASCARTESPVALDRTPPISTRPVPWDIQSSGEGTALVLEDKPGITSLRLFCPAGTGKLLLNVPEFDPISSEERLSFGQGGEAEALVADPSGDSARGGVTGEGPVPRKLASLLSGQVSASYGAQISGPHPAPPADLVMAFVADCSIGASHAGTQSRELTDTPLPTPIGVSPCLTQDGQAIPASNLRAVGTEPFWGAKVEGRCVTYSHPEDQSGTRVWTKFSGSATNGTWTGSLDGQLFIMRTLPRAGCSDGMSDNLYPIAVSLTVGGEQRNGCAEPR